MQKSPIPEDGVMCQLTAFKQSCKKCVVDHKCRAWVRVSGKDKDSDGAIDLYGCAYTMEPLINAQGIAQLSMMLEIVAKEVNSLRLEVQGGRVDPLLSQLGEINGRMQQLTSEQKTAVIRGEPKPKLIGSE